MSNNLDDRELFDQMEAEFKPYQKRVKKEYEELSDKLKKLRAFVCSKEGASIDRTELWILHRQISAMQIYKNILHRRLSLFCVQAKKEQLSRKKE